MIEFIFCAGARRSASTWLYNLTVALAEQHEAGGGVGFIRHMEFAAVNRQSGVTIMKTHAFIPEAAALMAEGRAAALVTYRDPRDIAISLMQFRGLSYEHVLQRDLPAVGREFESWAAWASGPDASATLIKYEDIFGDAVAGAAVVGIIAGLLGVTVSEEYATRLLERYSLDNQRRRANALERWDARSTLHPGHVIDGRSGRWEGLFTTAQERDLLNAAGMLGRMYK